MRNDARLSVSVERSSRRKSPAPLPSEKPAMKIVLRVGTAPNSPHATATLPLCSASSAPCKVIATADRDAKVMLCLFLLRPCPAAARIYPRSVPASTLTTGAVHTHPCRRQQFSRARHGVPVPILPMSRVFREELEPQEIAST